MKNVEDAYRLLTAELLEFISHDKWDCAGTRTSVFSRMTETSYWRKLGDAVIEDDRFPSLDTAVPASRAALYLRDNLLKTTGQRIWGLTFTLYPDGKFNIEYDYTKPVGYEESHETISLDEALGGLMSSGAQAEVSDPGTTRPERDLLSRALARLQAQTEQHGAAWGLGDETNWNLDMNEGRLRFSFADGHVVEAPVQVVGTYNTKDGTFMWGWDHPSVPEPLRRAAKRMYDYGAANGVDRFTTRIIDCTEDDAWELTGAAASLDGAAGAYRGDAGGTLVYMAFGEINTGCE